MCQLPLEFLIIKIIYLSILIKFIYFLDQFTSYYKELINNTKTFLIDNSKYIKLVINIHILGVTINNYF